MSKLSSYLSMCHKAGYLIIGCDNLIGYTKKLYVVLLSPTASDKVKAVAKQLSEIKEIKILQLKEDVFSLIGINNCQIAAIKNLGLTNAIINNCLEEYKII